MDKQFTNDEKGFKINIKRFCFPASYEIECPTCKATMIDDLSDSYLSYPVIGNENTRYFHCNYCKSEYKLNIVLKSVSIELEIDVRKLKKQ